MKLAEALDDRASFRRFCGFSRNEATPERTAFVRFRRTLVRLGLGDRLFDVITEQLCRQHVEVKRGTLVDATIIASASKEDGEARWVKHKNRKAVHGYKAHVACDEDTALIERVAVTPAHINDGKAGCNIIPDDPGEVYADSAYRGERFRKAVEARGGRARVVVTGVWARRHEDAAAIPTTIPDRQGKYLSATKNKQEIKRISDPCTDLLNESKTAAADTIPSSRPQRSGAPGSIPTKFEPTLAVQISAAWIPDIRWRGFRYDGEEGDPKKGPRPVVRPGSRLSRKTSGRDNDARSE